MAHASRRIAFTASKNSWLKENVQGTRQFHTQGGPLRKEDLYTVLGIARNATQTDIKKAYYKLAKEYHPDTNRNNPDASRKFARVASAYETLGKADQRQKYDMTAGTAPGTAPGQKPPGAKRGAPAQKTSSPDEIRAEEVFRAFQEQFGRNFDFADFAERYSYESSQMIEVQLSFDEAALGCEREMEISYTGLCPHCHGMRSEPGSETIMCANCGGTGEKLLSTGFFNMRGTCYVCSGKGFLFTTSCKVCNGMGQSHQVKKIVLPFPPGVSDGQTISVPVEGPGRVYVKLSVKDSEAFIREGYDLHSDVHITYPQAVRGGTARIKGLTGLIDLKIPAGTQSHATLRLGGRGIKRLNGIGHGDHFVHIKIIVPTNLTSKHRALIDKLAETEGDADTMKVREENPGFLRRLWNSLFETYDPEKDKEEQDTKKRQSGRG